MLFCPKHKKVQISQLWVGPPAGCLRSRSVGENTKATWKKLLFLKPSSHTFMFLYAIHRPPTHFSSFFSLSSLFNRCTNLHAWISSRIANPLPLSLSFSFPPPPVVVHADNPVRDLDVYRRTVRVAAQKRMSVCVCVWVCMWWAWGLLLEWPRCHRDERPFPALCICLLCVSISVPHVCIHVSLRE